MRMINRWVIALSSSVLFAACGPTVDLKTGLTVERLSTGWLDAGIVNGSNKLVPTISFALTNVSGNTLPAVQVNAVFRREGDTKEWGADFRSVAGTDGLTPGAVTRAVVLRSPVGYTGNDPRADLLRNAAFVDAKVDLFAKYGSAQWVRLGEFPIERQRIR